MVELVAVVGETPGTHVGHSAAGELAPSQGLIPDLGEVVFGLRQRRSPNIGKCTGRPSSWVVHHQAR